ncbi:MAG: ATP-dependent endonuclease [Candidatus Pristimantibacillus sp.]
MWLDELQIRGYRSFSNEAGIHLKGFQKINLLIGANNIGKSNLPRFIKYLRQPNILTHQYIYETDSWKQGEGVLIDSKLSFVTPGQKDQVKKSFQFTQQMKKEPVVVGEPSEFKEYVYNHIQLFSDARGFINKNGLIQPSHQKLDPHMEGVRWADMIYELGIFNYDWYVYYLERMEVHLTQLLNEPVKFNVLTEIKEPGQDLRTREQFKDRAEAIKSRDTTIPHIQERAEFRIQLRRDNQWREFELQDLGSGTMQFILLLSSLFTRINEYSNIFIEEIELNMHTKALIQLVNILEHDTDFKKHRYFLITHSSAILDQLSSAYSVHLFGRHPDGSTNAKLCTQRSDLHVLLDEMGVSPSQLLQSNMVIWLEGPSDKIYLKKWIELKAIQRNKEYIEGKHYSFVYYGGALLSHYNVDIKEDDEKSDEIDSLIDIMATSRYSAVVCDSDLGINRKQLKPRVQQISERLQHKPELQPFVFQWITEGREIENYVPRALMEDVIINNIPLRDSFKFKDKIIKFAKPNNKMIQHKVFKKDDSFDQFFAHVYLRPNEKNNKPYVKALTNNVAASFNKIVIAKQVVSKWEQQHFTELDINTQMDKLMDFIDKAQNS